MPAPLGRFSKNMPRPPGIFCPTLSQHPHNEQIALYTITFLPPGRFFCLILSSPIHENRQYEHITSNLSFSEKELRKSFSLRGEKHFSSRREYIILARRILYLREDNFLCVVITEEIALSNTSEGTILLYAEATKKTATRQKCNCIGGGRG